VGAASLSPHEAATAHGWTLLDRRRVHRAELADVTHTFEVDIVQSTVLAQRNLLRAFYDTAKGKHNEAAHHDYCLTGTGSGPGAD
jgi:hypothetical protein